MFRTMATTNERGKDANDSDSDNGEDKELVLTDYDRTRKMVPLVQKAEIVMNTKILATELTCPICLDLLTSTMTTKECLHRFCFDCISMALLRGNKECPTCRTKLVSKRSLRHDTNFDDLIRKVWPDRHKYESMLAVADEEPDECMRTVRYVTPYKESSTPPAIDVLDNDAPTPPALFDQGRPDTVDLDDDLGRRTPPWFHVSNIREGALDKYEKQLFMEAHEAYLKLKSRRPLCKDWTDEDSDSEKNDQKSKHVTRESSAPTEGTSTANTQNGRKTAKEKKTKKGNHDESRPSSLESNDRPIGTVETGAEQEKDEVDDLEMMDPELMLIDVEHSTGLELQPDSPSSSPPSTDNNKTTDKKRIGKKPIDILKDLNPPFGETTEAYSELNPNAKGATWLPPEVWLEQQQQLQQQQPQTTDDDDEEVVYDEDDLISVVSIDELLHEIEMLVSKEIDENPIDVKPYDIDRDLEEETDMDEYLCDETREDLREINEMQVGTYDDLRASLEDKEQFDMMDNITWRTQIKDGEEHIYYEKNKMPISKGKRKDFTVYDVEEETARLKRRMTVKDVLDSMSDTDSDTDDPLTASLASSPVSSELSLSDAEYEDEDEDDFPLTSSPIPPNSPTKETPSSSSSISSDVRPPIGTSSNKDRLHRWLGEIQTNHPLTPEYDLDRRALDDDEVDEGEPLPENYEIEAELRPSAALLSRNVPREVLRTRFIRTHHNATMEHLQEYLHLRWMEEVHNRTKDHDVAPDVPRPDHFYVFNRVDKYCKCVLLNEPLVTAQSFTARDDHVVIYFDTERAVLSSKEMSLLQKIVPQKDRCDSPTGSRISTGSDTASSRVSS